MVVFSTKIDRLYVNRIHVQCMVVFSTKIDRLYVNNTLSVHGCNPHEKRQASRKQNTRSVHGCNQHKNRILYVNRIHVQCMVVISTKIDRLYVNRIHAFNEGEYSIVLLHLGQSCEHQGHTNSVNIKEIVI